MSGASLFGGLDMAELRSQPLEVVIVGGGSTGGGTSTDGLTDEELRATPVPVSGTVAVSGTVPVSGTVAVSNLPATQPVSGTVAVSNLPATQPVSIAATVAVGGTVAVSNLPATQPVSGSVSVSNFPATQPVSGTVTATVSGTVTATGPVTNTEIRATPLPVSGSVSVSNLPATQPVSGTVAVSNFPATQPVSLASAPTTPVTGTFWQATQPVSGTVAISNAVALDATLTGGSQVAIVKTAAKGSTVAGSPTSTAVDVNTQGLDVSVKGTVPVSGTFFQGTQPISIASMPSTPVTGTFFQATQPVSGTVAVSNFPATQPVSGTFFQATQPVSLATAPTTPVTGTFWQATQPVSGTVTASGPLTDTQLRASAVPVSGPLTDTQIRTTPLPVSGTVTANAAQSGTWTVQPGNTANTTAWKVDGSAVTQPVSIAGTVATSLAALPALADKASASNNTIGSVTLGNSQGKSLAMKTGSIVSTATSADQVILTYTVTAGKTFYLQYLNLQCRLTTFAATATLFGTASLESPAGTKLLTRQIVGTGVYDDSPGLQFTEPLPFAAGVVIRVVCTPAAITSFTWQASFGGFER